MITAIVDFLLCQLDYYSSIKAKKTKLFNVSLEKEKGNTKAKLKLSIYQIDYLNNLFIPFLDSLIFLSKKSLDYDDFK